MEMLTVGGALATAVLLPGLLGAGVGALIIRSTWRATAGVVDAAACSWVAVRAGS
jgi:hypothetical protein